MKFFKRITRRFRNDIYVSRIDGEGDNLEIVKEYAACTSCGRILKARDISTCSICERFLCSDCRYKVGFRILCRDCLRETFPLTIYEYIYLDLLIRNGSLSIRELSQMLNENPDMVYSVLYSLMHRGLVREYGFISRYYSPTIQGILIRNLYRDVYDKHVK